MHVEVGELLQELAEQQRKNRRLEKENASLKAECSNLRKQRDEALESSRVSREFANGQLQTHDRAITVNLWNRAVKRFIHKK